MATETKSNTFNSEFRKVTAPLGAKLDRIDSSAKHTLGQHASDSRGGVYVYLRGVASVVQFSWVSYNLLGSLTSADEYGWYQIQGPGYARYLTSMALGNTVQATSTGGVMDDANTTTVVGVKCQETEGGTGTDNLKTFFVFPPQAGIAL